MLDTVLKWTRSLFSNEQEQKNEKLLKTTERTRWLPSMKWQETPWFKIRWQRGFRPKFEDWYTLFDSFFNKLTDLINWVQLSEEVQTKIDAASGFFSFKGTYDPNTDLTNTGDQLPEPSEDNKGWMYVISADGYLDGTDVKQGDIIVSNGTDWLHVSNNSRVVSVFGRTGDVKAQVSDYNTSLIPENGNLYFTNQRAIDALAPSLNTKIGYIQGTNQVIVDKGLICAMDESGGHQEAGLAWRRILDESYLMSFRCWDNGAYTGGNFGLKPQALWYVNHGREGMGTPFEIEPTGNNWDTNFKIEGRVRGMIITMEAGSETSIQANAGDITSLLDTISTVKENGIYRLSATNTNPLISIHKLRNHTNVDTNEYTERDYKGIDQNQLIALMLGEIKSLKERIIALEQKNAY